MWKLNCTLGQEEAVSRTAVISRINTTMVLVRFYGEKRRGGLAARDVNSPAIFIPRGFGESGNGNLSFPGFRVWGISGSFLFQI